MNVNPIPLTPSRMPALSAADCDSIRAEAKRPLNVLHVIASVSPKRGGPSTAVRHMITALHGQGITADVATTDDFDTGQRMAIATNNFLIDNGMRVRHFKIKIEPYTVAPSMIGWLWRNIHRYDVVHAHALFTFAPMVAAAIAWMRNVPYILRPAGILNAWGLQNRRRIAKRISMQMIEGPLLRRAAAVQCTSKDEADQLVKSFPELAPRIVVIPHGLDLTVESTTTPYAEFEQPTVVFLSRISPVKGIDTLLASFARLRSDMPQVQLVIAGDGPQDYVDQLKHRAQELGIASNTRWMGHVAGDTKTQLLQRASVFVLPSHSENFGVVVVEAMANRTAVVVASGAAIAEHVSAANAGIVVNHSVDELYVALRTLLNDPPRRVACGNAGFAYALKEFSLHTQGSRLATLYRAACNRSSSR